MATDSDCITISELIARLEALRAQYGDDAACFVDADERGRWDLARDEVTAVELGDYDSGKFIPNGKWGIVIGAPDWDKLSLDDKRR